MSLDFYRAFEDRHRGSRETIQERQRTYLPFLRDLAAAYPQAGVTDVGCGRGEWLELLRDEGIPAQGVDLDEGMLAACRERGLDVRRGDAIAFLQTLPADSQLAVSGFHIAEHLPFGTLHLLVAEALRVLRPGGVLILETPNPENLVVGTANFYLDPTHERPLPWQLLSFLAEHHGFARVTTLRMQESPSLSARVSGNEALSLMDVLGGASPDYAIVAQKAAPGQPGLLDTAFGLQRGLSLDTLAAHYDGKLKSDIHVASVNAVQAERHAREASDFAVRSEALLQHLQHRLAHAEQSAHAAYALAESVRQELARRTLRHQVGRVVRRVLTPAVRLRLVAITRRLGIYAPLRALYRRLRPLPPTASPGTEGPAAADAPQTDALPASARRALEQLDPTSPTDGDRR